MASWCGSTRSFCREQETQGRRRCGENMPTEFWSLGREWGHGDTGEGQREALVGLMTKGSLISLWTDW